MKVLIKTKLLEGKYVEARDYELFKSPVKLILCSNDNYKTHNHSEEPYMILTIAQQKNGRVTNTQQSKFPPYKYYKMYKYLWKPKSKVQEEISIPIDTRLKLREMWREVLNR